MQEENLARSNSIETTISKPIAFLCTSMAKGGLELNIAKLAKKFLLMGYPTLLITKQGSPLESIAHEYGLPYHSIALGSEKFALKAAKQVNKILKDHHCTNLISSSPKTNYLAAYSKAFFSKHLTLAYYQQMQLGKTKKGPVHRFVHGQLNYWMAPLPYLAKQAVEKTGISPEKVSIVPLAVNLSDYENLPNQKDARSQLGIPSDGLLFGLPGRLDPLKNQDKAIEALAIYKKNGGRGKLLLVGEETLDNPEGYRAQISLSIERLGLQEEVLLLPFQADMKLVYAAMDALLMLTKKETFGMVTVEAMLCKVPVIGSKEGGTAEILQYGKLGSLIDVEQPSEIAKAMQLLEHGSLAGDVLEKAKEHAKKKFDLELVVDQISFQLGLRDSTTSDK